MKGLSLLSSGIDSPVATYLMKKKFEIDCIFFYQGRFSGKTNKNKVIKLAKKLEINKLYIVNLEEVMESIVKHCFDRYRCVLCKRMMYRVAERIAYENGYDFLVTGESLGQVASQTLDNLEINDKAVKIIIHRPLIGYDKQETINIAKDIGTYDISIIKEGKCKALPKNPTTKASQKRILSEEKKIESDLINPEIIEIQKA